MKRNPFIIALALAGVLSATACDRPDDTAGTSNYGPGGDASRGAQGPMAPQDQGNAMQRSPDTAPSSSAPSDASGSANSGSANTGGTGSSAGGSQ